MSYSGMAVRSGANRGCILPALFTRATWRLFATIPGTVLYAAFSSSPSRGGANTSGETDLARLRRPPLAVLALSTSAADALTASAATSSRRSPLRKQGRS